MDVGEAAWLEEQKSLFLLNCSYFAATAFLAYDICLTMDDEVEYIWKKSHRMLTKWAYLVLRYYTLFVLISLWFCFTPMGISIGFTRPFNCIAWYKFQTSSLQIITSLMELILILRVYALYGRSRMISLLLLVTFVTEQAVMSWSMAKIIPGIKFTENCTTVDIPDVSIWFGITPILFEFMLLGMTVFKAVTSTRNDQVQTPLFRILVRDGMWVFFAVFLTFGLNGLFYLAIRGPKNAIAWAWQYAISALSGCRLVLHMHANTAPRPWLSDSTTAGSSCDRRRPRHNEATTESDFALTTFPHAGPIIMDVESNADYSHAAPAHTTHHG